MNREFYHRLADAGLQEHDLSYEACEKILKSPQVELLPLLNAAFEVRHKYWGKDVNIHIINNAQNGHCPEDCHYCAQAKTSQTDIEEYPLKPDEEIYEEAKRAYESGAFRYCMVFAGRGPSQRRVEHLSRLIKEIKSRYPIQICVSTGLLDQDKAQVLKDAGLDRLNHNLNTSESHYPNICTTHTYADRLNTLQAAKNVGIELCSGLIAGMGEKEHDIIEVAKTLRRLKAESIPVNFLIPIQGTQLKSTTTSELSPEYCLRILCLYRFLNPKAELRVAAGRELHLRNMEVMALYPANSLFLQGYLNTKGSSRAKTLRMIKDAGFTIKSTIDFDELLAKVEAEPRGLAEKNSENYFEIKELKDLRPHFQSQTK